MEDSLNGALTNGHWYTEVESATALDLILEEIGLFKVYKEVTGSFVHPRLDQPPSRPRIDRILVPNSKLINLGWNQGIIGIEIKASGQKFGPGLSQTFDYSRSVFSIGPANFQIHLSWAFLWPVAPTRGNLASWMAHNRVGSADSGTYDRFRLKAGESLLIAVSNGGLATLGNPTCGKRGGHQG